MAATGTEIAPAPGPMAWQPQPPRTWEPTALQQQLLQATVGPAALAFDAWSAWEQAIDIEHLDEGSYWVLPRLYRRLQAQELTGPPAATLQRLKGVYRHVWSRNQMLLRWYAEAIQALQSAAIPSVVLGGVGLVTLPGADLGSRRGDDGAIWIPLEHVSEAIACLATLGWYPITSVSPDPQDGWRTSLSLRQGQYALPLCWRVLPECPALGAAGTDAPGARVQVGTVDAIALSPTDQLLLCCVQATRWQPRPPFYALADAVTLIQDYPIDWQRLAHLAQQHQLTLTVREALSWVAQIAPQLELAAIRQHLQEPVITGFEQAEFVAKRQPHPLFGQLLWHWFEFRRCTPQLLPYQRWLAFPNYLKERWGLRQYRQLAWHVSKQGLKRLGQRVSVLPGIKYPLN